jgi:hypothetical protein
MEGVATVGSAGLGGEVVAGEPAGRHVGGNAAKGCCTAGLAILDLKHNREVFTIPNKCLRCNNNNLIEGR